MRNSNIHYKLREKVKILESKGVNKKYVNGIACVIDALGFSSLDSLYWAIDKIRKGKP